MKNKAKKLLREQEKERYKETLDRIHQLEVEAAQFARVLRISHHREQISEEENTRLRAMFEQLQAESEAARNKLEAEHDAAMEGLEAYASELNVTILSLETEIDELKRPWWRRWWQIWKETKMEGKKGS